MATRKPASSNAMGIHVSQTRLALLEALSHLKQAVARAPTHKTRLASKVTALRRLFDSLELFMDHTPVKRRAAKKAPAKRKPAPKAPAKRKAPAKAKPRKPMATKKTKALKPKPAGYPKASVEEQIIAVAEMLGGNRSNDVAIAKLREALPSVARKDFDVALRWLHGEGNVALYRSDVPIDITEADKAGAFMVGDEPRHLLYVLNPSVTSVHPSKANLAPEPSPAPKPKIVPLEDMILRNLKAIDNLRPGDLHLVKRLRSRVLQAHDVSKPAFDAAMLRLMRDRTIVMHFHDFPSSLSKAELEQFVFDKSGHGGEGTYYHAVALPRETVSSSVVAPPSSDSLHARIAKALGWTVQEAQSFSLPALRDLVRPVSPKLAEEITLRIQH